MTALVRHEDGKALNWGANLVGNDTDGFQWKIVLETIVDEEDNRRIYETTNRGWRIVGPEFKTRNEGSRFLGFEPGHKGDTSKNWDRLIEEYHGLYSDEIETRERFNAENKPKFGRPSQGRTERLQVAITPALRQKIKNQTKPGESESQAVFRLLEAALK
jgi:hypothetical protein